MATPRILGSDEERNDDTSLSSNDDFSSNNSQVSLSLGRSYSGAKGAMTPTFFGDIAKFSEVGAIFHTLR